MTDPVVQNFLSLVQIDSPSGREAKLADYLIARLKKIGLTFIRDSGGNIYSRTPKSGESVVICAHLDTVEPGKGIKPQIKDGNIHSDGTTILGADNKAALAAIITVLESVPLNHIRPLEIIFTTREETDGGVSKFDFSQIKSKSGLIADHAAPIGSIVLTSPGIVNLNIEIIGKSAHSSLPQDSINALTVAARCLFRSNWGKVDSDTTANIGLISGGTAMNTIPGRVNLTGEVRSFNPRSLDQTISRIRSIFQSECKLSGALLNFTTQKYCQGYSYNSDSTAVSVIASVLATHKVKVFYDKAFGASDTNVFVANGINVVTIGDACNFPHTVNESISISNLILLTKIFHSYLTG